MKTIFQSSFSVGKYFRTKIQSIFLIYSIENSIFFINVTRRVYLGGNAMFMNERLFGNTSVFF